MVTLRVALGPGVSTCMPPIRTVRLSGVSCVQLLPPSVTAARRSGWYTMAKEPGVQARGIPVVYTSGV